MRTRLFAALLISLIVAAPASAQSAPVPEGAVWTEHTIPSADGVELHADLLRPEAVGDAKTPVILMIGPYFGHSGQLGAVGAAPLVGGEPYDPVGPSEGPSARFHDLINGAKLIERGYSVLMVDLRGFGGSSG